MNDKWKLKDKVKRIRNVVEEVKSEGTGQRVWKGYSSIEGWSRMDKKLKEWRDGAERYFRRGRNNEMKKSNQQF